MKKSIANITNKRRKFVFEEFSKWKEKNPKTSNKEKSKKMKDLWTEAKSKFK